MALETLKHSQCTAAELTGVPVPAPESHVHCLGTIAIDGNDYPAFRAHSGPVEACNTDKLIGKGGIRMAMYPSVEIATATAEELDVEMLYKLGLRGYARMYKGAKGLIVADARILSHLHRAEAMRQYERLMEDAGLAGPRIDVPAGDVGTNGLADVYAQEYQRLHQEEELWQAVITGKSSDLGGLALRPGATGKYSYIAHRTLMDARNIPYATSAMQGFGNAAAWYAYAACQEPEQRVFISAISEVEGMLATDDPRGLHITLEMVLLVGDNPKFAEDFPGRTKLAVLTEMIRKNQQGIHLKFTRDSSRIFELPVDYFVPAAMGNVITKENVSQLQAKCGVIEIANGPTDAYAHNHLVGKGLDVLPDIAVNGGGVDASIEEHRANLERREPDEEEIAADLGRTTIQLTNEVIHVANKLETPDLRVAAAALSNARTTHNSVLEEQLLAA